MAEAKAATMAYFHTRQHVRYLYDYRSNDALLPMRVSEHPYDFQASLQLAGDLHDFCVTAGRALLEHRYILPGGRRGSYDLGPQFEHTIHFRFPDDLGKRHRNALDMFVRGQLFEYLAVLYHEDGDPAVIDCFRDFLALFGDVYARTRAHGGRCARFQTSEDRDVMSVG